MGPGDSIVSKPEAKKETTEPELVIIEDDKKHRLNAIFETLSEEQKTQALSLLQKFAEKSQQITPPPLPEVDGGYMTYKKFRAKTKSTDGKALLAQEWGQWLKAFNPKLDRDYMSQADLRKLDKPLLNRLREDYTAAKLSQIIPTLPMLNDQIAKSLTPEEKKKIFRDYHLANRKLNHGIS